MQKTHPFSLCHFKTFHHLCSAQNTMVVKLFHSAGHRSIARLYETGFFYAPSTVACNGLNSLGNTGCRLHTKLSEPAII